MISLEPVTSLSLAPHRPQSETECPQSKLIHENRDTGLILDGAILEAQYRSQAGEFLVLLTHDCPYEEQLDAYLVSPEFQVLERRTLLWPYAPGIFKDPAFTSPDTLRFVFHSTEEPYELQVLESPRWSWFKRRRLRLRRLKL